MLTTIAVQVHHMDNMVAFYRDALGFSFRAVDTFGLASQFGTRDGLTLKFVPLREAADFDGFPSHQLGFRVADVEAVIATALQHGGRTEGEVQTTDEIAHGAVRDPDGNTVELYG